MIVERTNHMFNVLREQRILRTQEDFSENWLGKSARYYSMLLATKREPSLHAIWNLANRLERFGDDLTRMPSLMAKGLVLKNEAQNLRAEINANAFNF